MPQVAAPVTIVKQGCFDADVVNALNTSFTGVAFPNGSTIVGSINNAAVPFGNYTTGGTVVTLLPAGAPAGTYSLTMYAVITTTFATATAVQHVLGYTDDQGARTVTAALAALTAGTLLSTVVMLRSTGAAAITITEQATVASATAGAMALSAILIRVA